MYSLDFSPAISSGGAGLGSNAPDLWCTYAAVRTLAWLGATETADASAIRDYILSRQNRDGGYAWSRGMTSDAWATFYCTETLKDLGCLPKRLDDSAEWLRGLFDGRAFAMVRGQHADVWATHYATRTLYGVCGEPLADRRAALHDWLATLQSENGGIAWSPGFASKNVADARACFYGVFAWSAITDNHIDPTPWNKERLIDWLQARQTESGGFQFSERATTPCLWATYRATATLTALGAKPLATDRCIAWIRSRRGSSGGFVRWPGYDGEDVWAAFCAVGALKALDVSVDDLAPAIIDNINAMYLMPGGYTYRNPSTAFDTLTTAAGALLAPNEQTVQALTEWIESCQLPNEGGIMYMPGRGAEVRCTAWALAAGCFRDNSSARARIVDWLGDIQNPDGGFGFWEGRGSDLVSTASAISIVDLTGAVDAVNLDRLLEFVLGCAKSDRGESFRRFSNYPGGEPSLRASLHAFKCLRMANLADSEEVHRVISAHAVRQGGFANVGNRIPDLQSTYEAVAAAIRDRLPLERSSLSRFLRGVQIEGGFGWTPLYKEGYDALSNCLGTLLDRYLSGSVDHLPDLHLS